MVNKEMIHRLKTAGSYQRKALRALFPEEISEHLDVIESEIKAMLLELTMDMVMEYKNKQDCYDKTTTSDKTESETTTNCKSENDIKRNINSKIKKVNIQ